MSALIVDHDGVGAIAERDGIRFYLTPCCGTDVTGVAETEANPHGVACRACRKAVDPRLAAAWLTEETT